MTGGKGTRPAAWLAAWVERGRKSGILLLILGLCAGLGLLIALPLWLFATREPRAYTVFALALLAGGAVLIVVRAVVRRRRLPADPGRPGSPVLSRVLSFVITLFTLAGLYGAAVLFYRGLWILGSTVVAIAGLLLWLLGAARKAARKRRKPPPIPAENSGR